MPNLGEAYNFLFGIKIVRDSICGLVKFSWKTYINHFIKTFSMQNYSFGEVPIVKADKLSRSKRYKMKEKSTKQIS